MKYFPYFLLFIIALSCKKNMFGERSLYLNKVDAFLILENYHDELHIMIGEDHDDDFHDDEEISPEVAFTSFKKAIYDSNNPELIPIKNSFNRIGDSFSIGSDEIVKLDLLVDQYQVGLQVQITGILRGHGLDWPPNTNNLIDIYSSNVK